MGSWYPVSLSLECAQVPEKKPIPGSESKLYLVLQFVSECGHLIFLVQIHRGRVRPSHFTKDLVRALGSEGLHAVLALVVDTSACEAYAGLGHLFVFSLASIETYSAPL